MGLFDKSGAERTEERVAKYLEPHEQARWIVPAQGGLHPFMMLLPALMAIIAIVVSADNPAIQVALVAVTMFLVAAALTTARYRLLAITDDDIVVLRTRALRPTRPVELLGRVPRERKLEVQGSFWGLIQVGGERLWAHKRFHGTLDEADRHLGEGARRGSSSAYRANRAKKRVKNVRRR